MCLESVIEMDIDIMGSIALRGAGVHLESAITIDMDIKLYYNKSNHDRGQNCVWIV